MWALLQLWWKEHGRHQRGAAITSEVMGFVTRAGVAWRHAVVPCAIRTSIAQPGRTAAAPLAVYQGDEPARSRDAVRILDAPRELHRDRPDTTEPAGAAGARRDPGSPVARAQSSPRGRRLRARLSADTAC